MFREDLRVDGRARMRTPCRLQHIGKFDSSGQTGRSESDDVHGPQTQSRKNSEDIAIDLSSGSHVVINPTNSDVLNHFAEDLQRGTILDSRVSTGGSYDSSPSLSKSMSKKLP